MVLIHYVHAVTDALRVRLFYSETDVAAKTVGRDQTRRKLARMQANVDFGIKIVQESHHAHLERIVRHGGVAVLALNKIDGHNAGIGRGDLKSKQRLSKHHFLGIAPGNLKDVALLHPASWKFIGSATMFTLTTRGLGPVPVGMRRRDVIPQAVSQQFVAQLFEIVTP